MTPPDRPRPNERPPPRPGRPWHLGDLMMAIAVVAVGVWGMMRFSELVEGVAREAVRGYEVRIIE